MRTSLATQVVLWQSFIQLGSILPSKDLLTLSHWRNNVIPQKPNYKPCVFRDRGANQHTLKSLWRSRASSFTKWTSEIRGTTWSRMLSEKGILAIGNQAQ